MVVRSSKQKERATAQRNWRISLYGALTTCCVLYMCIVGVWYVKVNSALTARAQELERTPVYITIGHTHLYAAAFDYSAPSSVWYMTNKSHPITPHDYSPHDLAPLPLPMQSQLTGELGTARAIVARALTKLDTAAKNDDVHLMINSAYRSYQLQKQLITEVSSSLYDTGTRTAPAGTSEHQLGLAVDFSSDTSSCRTTSVCAISTQDADWLADNAHHYGFILRYPKGKEVITGYEYEPWHYRYVGRPLAEALHASSLTLDEVWPKLQAAEKELYARGEL